MLTPDQKTLQRARAANTRRISLAAALMSRSAYSLKTMAQWLAVPEPQPTRKSELAAAVERRLASTSLRRYWDDLDEIGQMAIREVLYGDGRGIDWHRFGAKYGVLPASVMRGQKVSSYPLGCFLHGTRGPEGRNEIVIPAELAQRLLEFVPPPPGVEIGVVQEVPPVIARERSYYDREGTEHEETVQCDVRQRAMETVAFQELAAMLRLTDLGRISVSAATGRATPATLRHITDELDGGDFYETSEPIDDRHEIGPIRAFAWPLLLQASTLATLQDSRLVLTKAGRAAIGAPPARTLSRIWRNWVKTSLLDEFNRIDLIEGQTSESGRNAMVAAPQRRPVIARALSECPVGSWIEFDEFSRYMKASGMNFSITRDPATLYIFDSYYGSLGQGGYSEWNILQERYLRCLLFEYAATLGMIDVAYTHPVGACSDYLNMWAGEGLKFLSRYDGLDFFRLTPLGAYCLGVAETCEPAFSPTCTPVTVLPDLRVRTGSGVSSEERLLLETFADAESDDVWRLSRDKTLTAIERGHRMEELRSFLAARNRQPLSEAIDRFLREVDFGAQALRPIGTALLIECVNETVAAQLVEDARTSTLCMRTGRNHLVVRDSSAAAFRAAVREMGFRMPCS